MSSVHAPELHGSTPVNTGSPVRLRDLRGRYVLLEFWTAECVNCIHTFAEIDALSTEFGDALAVIGVHSPKFDHLRPDEVVAQAVERYGLRHPVVNDPDLAVWDAYTVKAWPTLVLVDPRGRVVAQERGEGHGPALAAIIRAGSTGDAGPSATADGVVKPVEEHPPADGLWFPSAAVLATDASGGSELLVADTGHDAVVQLDPRTGAERARWSGFSAPRGLCVLPEDVAAEVGYDVVVADTAAHRLAGLSSRTGAVTPLAGDGRRGLPGERGRSLASPWALAWWRDKVWIGMAGTHELWTYDPGSGAVAWAAGSGHEALVDGPPDVACFAQPSGLAADGDRLWVADAESSALRWLDDDGVHTAVGAGLSAYGLVDGGRDDARLQHPRGLAVLADATIAIADAFNGAVRRFDPAQGRLTTMAVGLNEPSAVLASTGGIAVVESGAHRVVWLREGQTVELAPKPQAHPAPVQLLRPGAVTIDVRLDLPAGDRLDDRYGPPARLTVTSTPSHLVRDGDGQADGLTRAIELDPAVGGGFLHVAARAVSCPDHADVGAACHLHRRDWTIEVAVDASGDDRLTLSLEG